MTDKDIPNNHSITSEPNDFNGEDQKNNEDKTGQLQVNPNHENTVFSRPNLIKRYNKDLSKYGFKRESNDKDRSQEYEELVSKIALVNFESDISEEEYKQLFSGITYKLNYNILFCTKFNRELFEGPVKSRMEELIKQRYKGSSTVDIEMVDVKGNHIMIQCKSSPAFSSFDILSGIKEFTTQKFREEKPEFFEKGYSSLWSKHFMIHTDEITPDQKEAFIDYHRRQFYTYKTNKDKPENLQLENINYEILFVTRRNRDILVSKFKEALHEIILQVLAKDKWQGIILNKLDIGLNYCNLSLNVAGRHSPAKLIYDLKRESSSALMKKYPTYVGKTALWTHSYLISTEEIPENIKKSYIEFHKENFTSAKRKLGKSKMD